MPSNSATSSRTDHKKVIKYKRRIMQNKIQNLHDRLQNYKSEIAKLKNYNNMKWRELVSNKQRFLALKESLYADFNDLVSRNRKFERMMKRVRKANKQAPR